MRASHQSLWATAVFATVLGLISAVPAAAREYYAGKTLTMLVPSSAGGGLTVIIRAFAKVYTRHIPGKPTIVVKNMPGGGGTRSLNYLYSRAKPDGLTINFGSWNAAGVVSKRKGIRYVPEKFAFIGAGSIPWVTVVRADLTPRISKATEIVKVAKFKVGGRSSDRSLDLVGNMSLQLIGASYKFIGGYRGSDFRVAHPGRRPPGVAGVLEQAGRGIRMRHLGVAVKLERSAVDTAVQWQQVEPDRMGAEIGRQKPDPQTPVRVRVVAMARRCRTRRPLRRPFALRRPQRLMRAAVAVEACEQVHAPRAV